ncbi:MAG: hypothetical protein J7L55_02465 [Desulfurococcales archaeon]|nr:hypothetical protein [Desulfurococcales archaeon]
MGVDTVMAISGKLIRKGKGFRVGVIVSLGVGTLIYLVGSKIPSPLIILFAIPSSLSAVFTDMDTYESLFYALMIVGLTPHSIQGVAFLSSALLGALVTIPYVLMSPIYFLVGWLLATLSGYAGTRYLFNWVKEKVASER